MKKILSALISASVLAGTLVPMIALAQATQCTLRYSMTDLDTNCYAGRTVSETITKLWGMCCILDALYTATNWIFIALAIVVMLLIAWGGFTIATAAGAPEKVASGRNYILYALIGLAVALLAKALPSVVRALLGM